MGSLRDFGSDLEKKLPQVFAICVIHHRTVNSLCRSFSARQPISEFWLRGKWVRANIRIEGGGDDERTLLSPHFFAHPKFGNCRSSAENPARRTPLWNTDCSFKKEWQKFSRARSNTLRLAISCLDSNVKTALSKFVSLWSHERTTLDSESKSWISDTWFISYTSTLLSESHILYVSIFL